MGAGGLTTQTLTPQRSLSLGAECAEKTADGIRAGSRTSDFRIWLSAVFQRCNTNLEPQRSLSLGAEDAEKTRYTGDGLRGWEMLWVAGGTPPTTAGGTPALRWGSPTLPCYILVSLA